MGKRENPGLFSDFDGTMADTSTPPGGLGVNEAYIRAITKLLGEEAAAQFEAGGGHHHRTPAEIVMALRPTLGQNKVERLAQEVTGLKLDILIGQIGMELSDGHRWPKPIAGFSATWLGAHESTGTAVISAGHTAFIKKWFEVQGLPPPDCMITTEVLHNMSIPLAEQAKPSPLLMRLAETTLAHLRGPLGAKIYVGDAPVDREFARNSAVPFVSVEPGQENAGWQKVGRLLLPSDRQLTNAS